MKTSHQQGRTMLETLLYLGVIGVLAMATFVLVNNVYDKFKLEKLLEQVKSLRQLINTKFLVDGNYEKLSCSKMPLEEGRSPIVPKDMKVANPDCASSDEFFALYHAYSGLVRIWPDNYPFEGAGAVANSDKKNVYKIQFEGLSAKECVELGMLNWVSQDSSDLVRMSIVNADAQNVEFVWVPKTAEEKNLPATLPNIYAGCSSKEGNSITWTFF